MSCLTRGYRGKGRLTDENRKTRAPLLQRPANTVGFQQSTSWQANGPDPVRGQQRNKAQAETFLHRSEK
jgi:hypothetical protein